MACQQPISLVGLPAEVVLHILAYLEVSDLFSLARTCCWLRSIACDPLLHLHRLHYAAYRLSCKLAHRPSRLSICPPNAWIWLGKTHVLSRSISKSLTRIRLTHNLEHRPTADELVARAILPSSCTSYSSIISPGLIQSRKSVEKHRLRDGLGRKLERRPTMDSLVSQNILPEECARRSISPGLLATRQQVIRETLKDGLRAWVEGRGVAAQKQRADDLDAAEKVTVKALVRRFTARRQANDLADQFDAMAMEKKRCQDRWGRQAQVTRTKEARQRDACSQPTRAHVLGLKKYWEGAIRAASV